MTINPNPTVHTFDSTGDAYDASQTDDAIRDGDVLHVPSEEVTGFLHQAWPVAVTPLVGKFHAAAQRLQADAESALDDPDGPFAGYAASIALARRTATS